MSEANGDDMVLYRFLRDDPLFRGALWFYPNEQPDTLAALTRLENGGLVTIRQHPAFDNPDTWLAEVLKDE